MKISKGAEFKKEFKKLKKKYPSLLKDLAVLEQLIGKFPKGEDSRHCNILKQLGEQYICKRRMMCRSVKSSEFRIIYYYNGQQLELHYIEIYYKGSQEVESCNRVERVWKEKTNAQ